MIRISGAVGNNHSNGDIEGSAQREVAVNLLLLDQRLDGLNISNVEGDSAAFSNTLGNPRVDLQLELIPRQSKFSGNGTDARNLPFRGVPENAWRASRSTSVDLPYH